MRFVCFVLFCFSCITFSFFRTLFKHLHAISKTDRPYAYCIRPKYWQYSIEILTTQTYWCGWSVCFFIFSFVVDDDSIASAIASGSGGSKRTGKTNREIGILFIFFSWIVWFFFLFYSFQFSHHKKRNSFACFDMTCVLLVFPCII